jgi:hypothetical protein
VTYIKVLKPGGSLVRFFRDTTLCVVRYTGPAGGMGVGGTLSTGWEKVETVNLFCAMGMFDQNVRLHIL